MRKSTGKTSRVMKGVMKLSRCGWCRQTFTPTGRGRKPRYCTRSHRQRAYEARLEKRKLASPLHAVQMDLATFEIRKIVISVLRELGFVPQGQPGQLLKLVKKKREMAGEIDERAV